MNWFKKKRILVPFDFSAECVNAVKVAVELAETNDDVHVLHVLVSLPATYPYAVWDDEADEKRMEATRVSMAEKLSGMNIKNVHLDVGVGNAGETITNLAKEVEAGLIVIPSHGRTGVNRILLGSVAERVVRLAPCPVLVLKNAVE